MKTRKKTSRLGIALPALLGQLRVERIRQKCHRSVRGPSFVRGRAQEEVRSSSGKRDWAASSSPRRYSR